MQIIYKNVVGTQAEAPAKVDTTSSPDVVYLRKNIKKTTIKMGEQSVEGYSYEEAELSHEQYQRYLAEQAEMDTEAFKLQAANGEAIMLALADIYTMLTTIGG